MGFSRGEIIGALGGVLVFYLASFSVWAGGNPDIEQLKGQKPGTYLIIPDSPGPGSSGASRSTVTIYYVTGHGRIRVIPGVTNRRESISRALTSSRRKAELEGQLPLLPSLSSVVTDPVPQAKAPEASPPESCPPVVTGLAAVKKQALRVLSLMSEMGTLVQKKVQTFMDDREAARNALERKKKLAAIIERITPIIAGTSSVSLLPLEEEGANVQFLLDRLKVCDREEGLFRMAGSNDRRAANVAQLILRGGQPAPELQGNCHTIADTLKSTLKHSGEKGEPPRRLFPEKVVEDLCGALSDKGSEAERKENAVKIYNDYLSKLDSGTPEDKVISEVIKKTILFLAKVASNSNTTKMLPSNLGISLGPSLAQDTGAEGLASLDYLAKTKDFLEFLIKSHPEYREPQPKSDAKE